MYAVIMAGGQGTRLWPLSRKKLPKQLHKLTGEKSLIQQTYDRLLPLIDPHNIIVSTTPEYVGPIKIQLPDVPDRNYIVEPFANGNAAACILVSLVLAKRDPGSVAVFLPADHSIKDNKLFLKIVDFSEKVIGKQSDHIVTIGITPSRSDTGLGYIQFAEKVDKSGNLVAHKVKRFVEKPDLKKAERFVKSGRYLWNAGMFVWRTDHFANLAKKFMPESYKVIRRIVGAYGTKDYEKKLLEEYCKAENNTVDYGIMEKTKDILVIPGDFGWSDIGSWGTLFEILSEIKEAKVVSIGRHVSCNDDNCLVMAGEGKLIATIGLRDIVVIDTDDATLICNRHQASKVKDLLAKLKEEGREEYL